ncbi:Gfo/Idh/MocA family oxidoreductase [Streptomyces sp. NBC_01619]|uniref:Gfo/Idh/MocA family oxidoreductase n=1 Tax=Streptomyces pratisoli TaxID=3139917 RepID=A0ACC6QQZ7_9ACTN|nr:MULTISPECIES: Gfo/Idh/MocA family oxidoreductase [unclassified Streptomyces]MCX4514453.1 Gfo/Idh/MocA family oxidoreductase [Streptomyces sp. NBC_01619]
MAGKEQRDIEAGPPPPVEPALGVGMVGYAFMGAAHSQGWRTVGRVFDLPLRPVLAAIGGRDAAAVRAAADRHGWAAAETDWRALIARDDVQVVDICTPGDSHAEIAVAALEAGKHVLCEKPLANSVAEAEAMVAAAEAAAARGQVAMVGFNYRRLPAIAYARRLIADGRLGALRHVRITYLQDWLVDPDFPLTWRLEREHAGSGALGDLGAHAVDLAQYLTGEQLVGVSALTETFVRERPLLAGASTGLSASGATGRGQVTVDDAALFTGRLASGALASFEATRMAAGRKNALRLEINGERGSLAFDLERLNELSFHDHTEPAVSAGFRRILVTEPDHPYLEAWWPPGHALGYEHTFVHQARDLVRAIAAGTTAPAPSFADGLQVQRVLAAVEESAEKNAVYTPVPV